MSDQAAIAIECPHCARSFRVRPAAAGRNVKCPGCGEAIAVPVQGARPTEFPDSVNQGPASRDSKPDDPFADLGQFQVETPAVVDRWDVASPSSPYQPPSTPPKSEPLGGIQIRSSNFMSRQYPALQVVRVILRVLAFLLIAVCLIGVMISSLSLLVATQKVSTGGSGALFGSGIAAILMFSLPMLFTSLILFSYAELISVFLDIQRNTQESAYHLRLKN